MTAAAVPADLLYGRLLALARGSRTPLGAVRRADGAVEPLPLERWLGPADSADFTVLERVAAPVLDVGCGPGRHVAALHARGCRALGLDLSPVAVSITRERGAEAVLGSVFHDVPDAGTWRTVLLLDGNVGIGGAPVTLLRRVRELLAPGGEIVAELEPPGARTGPTRVRLEGADSISEWFAWAHLSVDDAPATAAAAGLDVAWTLAAGGRWFAGLRP
jgi:SAM-dependent methyltransferase